MNNIEQAVVELYERWAGKPLESDEIARFVIHMFELMMEKYPAEMEAAFERGFSKRRSYSSNR